MAKKVIGYIKLQVKAGQTRHLHIGDKARCVVSLLGFKKFIGRGKRGSAVAESAHEALYRVAHGFIVIDDHNHRGFWQVRVPVAARYQVSAALGAGTPSEFQCAGAPPLRHVRINPNGSNMMFSTAAAPGRAPYPSMAHSYFCVLLVLPVRRSSRRSWRPVRRSSRRSWRPTRRS